MATRTKYLSFFAACLLALSSIKAQSNGQRGSTHGIGLQQSSPLSKEVENIDIPSTTFLTALLQIARSSDECMGVVLTKRSSALVETPAIRAEHAKVADLLDKVLESAKDSAVRLEQGCIVVEPIRNTPRYLKTAIPLFRTQRSPIQLQSHYLFQALLGTEPQPEHKGVWGVASSISSSTDDPQVGPINMRGKTVEKILCHIAKRGGSTVWIASRRNDDQYAPWTFLQYKGPTEVTSSQLRAIVGRMPN
jgi:hypothetical protein